MSFNTKKIARLQGAYFIVTGVWPLIHTRSFVAVTGSKPEAWLVKMVGLLTTAIGATLWQSSKQWGAPKPELRWLAVSSAASFAAIDVIYSARRRISPVYLLDAGIEAAFLAAWFRRS